MGICCCGSTGTPTTREQCAEIGCTYFEAPDLAPCLSDEGVTTCALLSTLHDHLVAKSDNDPVVLLAAGGTFTALQDLRDEILDRSPFGIELLTRYREHAPRAMEIISSDRELMEETLGVFLTGASFGMAILRHHHGRRGQALGPQRFTRETYDRGRAVLQRFREAAASQGEEERFREPLEFVEREIEFFVGNTPGQARRRLMEEQ